VGLLNDPRFTFAQAQARMKRTLVGAYKATPPSPTFVEARDAVLAVAVANGTADLSNFWAAFAGRGLGGLAKAPPRDAAGNRPVVEDFSIGGAFDLSNLSLDAVRPSCDDDGTLDVGETGAVTVHVRNLGTVPLVGATLTVSSTSAALQFPSGPSVTLPDVAPLDTLDVTVPAQLADDARGLLTFDVTARLRAARFTDDEVTAEFRCNYDVIPASSTNDDVEAPQTAWTATSSPAQGPATTFRRERLTATQHVWWAPSPLGTSDLWLISPPLDVGPQGLRVTFLHRYDFDRLGASLRDGAVVEVSSDDGVTWTDVGSALLPLYPGIIDEDQGRSTNPLKGRSAFVGQSANYPSFLTAMLDLSTRVNQTLRLRFRYAGDDGVAWAGRGWELDGFVFSGLRSPPFASLGIDPNSCVNHAPVATVASPLTVDESSRTSLMGAATDADQDAVTLTWTQTSGPAGVLVGSAFTAPEVTVDTPLQLTLIASDGRSMSAPAVLDVVVRNVNRVPTVKAPLSREATAGEQVTLQATTHDSDGDAVTVSWRQTTGTPLSLEGADTLTLRFVAPDVGEVAQAQLEVVAHDGQASSAPALINVTIRPAAVPAPAPEPATPTGCGCTQSWDMLGLWLLAAWARARAITRR
jgi:hypothetical protein